MCGIVAYSGSKDQLSLLINGLSRLEYRGYDSSGIAIVSPEGLFVEKKSGKINKALNYIFRALGNIETSIAKTRPQSTPTHIWY